MTSWIASVLKVSIHVSRVYSFVVSSCNVLFEMYLLGVSYVAISQLLLSWVRNLTVVLRCLFLFLRCLYTGMLDRRTSKSWSDRIVPSLYRIVLIFLVNENAILFTSFVLVNLIVVRLNLKVSSIGIRAEDYLNFFRPVHRVRCVFPDLFIEFKIYFAFCK